jgi:uncharacterized membrane protein (TIGR02234 family)
MAAPAKRTYAVTLIACLAGAGLALYAATRTWSVHVTPRVGISPLRTARTGADLEPWVAGLAVVALAGTGALLATRGTVRRALGVLLTLAGLGVLIGAIVGRAGLDRGTASPIWPVACAAGGVVIAAGGVLAVRHGHLWPAMSSRYERTPAPRRPADREPPTPTGDISDSPVGAPPDHRAAWEALDRGDDPTT